MNRKSLARTIIIFLVIVILAIGLTSCKLPASKGPQTSSDGFPVPGGSQETGSGIDVSAFATQTAQAQPPVVVNQTPGATGAPGSTSTSPNPAATSVPPSPEPTQAPIVYVQATPGGPPASYTLQKGEYPFCIARRFNVDISELLSLNGLTTSSPSSVGEVLKIPQTGNPFVGERALKPHPDYYKILPGDTVNTIACGYGDVSPDMIALQNGLTSYTGLPDGEVLVIP